MWTGVGSALLVALAAVGGCAGAGREPPLPAAGSDRDDGSGLLARASHRFYTRPATDAGIELAAPDAGSSSRWAEYRFRAGPVTDSEVPRYARDYAPTGAAGAGAIAGRLRWSRPPARDRLGNTCDGTAAAAPRHAIVYLQEIAVGRGFPESASPPRRWQLGGMLEIRRCGIEPYVQLVAPLGAVLAVRSQIAAPVRVRGRQRARPGERDGERFAIELAARGDEARAQLAEPGIIEVIAGDRRGWLLVAGHPYHAAVDGSGEFVLAEVPAGRYRLIAWHPPLTPDGPPIESARWVTVRRGATAEVELALP
jgi:hypothetical protein